MKKHKCRVCLLSNMAKAIPVKEMTLGTREVYEYFICDHCKSLNLSDVPKNLSALYENYPNLLSTRRPLAKKEKIFLHSLLGNNRCLSHFLSKVYISDFSLLRLTSLYSFLVRRDSKILDVGCGNAEFIFHLRELGYTNSFGIDPFLKEENINSFIERIDFSDTKEMYDIITFHHTFEHELYPHKVIQTISKALKHTGTCIIRVPNIESDAFHRYMENWEGIHAPFHIFLPTQLGMETMLKDSDLQISKMRWENPFYLAFYHENRKHDIADFEPEGAKKYYCSGGTSHPPKFSLEETKSIYSKAKKYDGTPKSDYICYYITKKHDSLF